MKTIILLRHARSEESTLLKPDQNRHLSDEGRKEIARVCERFGSFNIHPDLILCSSATRTAETFEIFAASTAYQGPVEYLDALYHASASEILEQIRPRAEDGKCLLLLGHNPGISQLADYLSATGCPTLSTSSMAILGFESLIEPGLGRLIHFIQTHTL